MDLKLGVISFMSWPQLSSDVMGIIRTMTNIVKIHLSLIFSVFSRWVVNLLSAAIQQDELMRVRQYDQFRTKKIEHRARIVDLEQPLPVHVFHPQRVSASDQTKCLHVFEISNCKRILNFLMSGWTNWRFLLNLLYGTGPPVCNVNDTMLMYIKSISILILDVFPRLEGRSGAQTRCVIFKPKLTSTDYLESQYDRSRFSFSNKRFV